MKFMEAVYFHMYAWVFSSVAAEHKFIVSSANKKSQNYANDSLYIHTSRACENMLLGYL